MHQETIKIIVCDNFKFNYTFNIKLSNTFTHLKILYNQCYTIYQYLNILHEIVLSTLVQIILTIKYFRIHRYI